MNTQSDHVGPKTVLQMTSKTVVAYLTYNKISPEALLSVVQGMYKAYADIASGPAPSSIPEPAVPIAKSVHEDYLICLEDGQKLIMLKRYLARRYNLSPEAYRARWNLPETYPMVAPSYTKEKSALAKRIGLGRRK